MNSYKETTPRFSLKDELFNRKKVLAISKEITQVYPAFKARAFVNRVTKKFPELELKERIEWIAHCLEFYIQEDYRTTTKILLESLPPELDPNLQDDDFGDFIYAPYGHYVATRGCNKKDVTFSLKALREMTKRFSVEGPIRAFINKFPEQTFSFLESCAKDKNYHIRRLASEGTRASLPWCHKIYTPYDKPLSLLNTLYVDETRYVTRSVANHMNDISKIDPKLVITTLKKWKSERSQDPKELEFIISHSLRTLVNQGHKDALAMVGYKKPQVVVSHMSAKNTKVPIGNNFEFSFKLTSNSKKSQRLLIDYLMYFQKKNGELSPKTFKIKKMDLPAGETVMLAKKHPMRSMSTKTLYPGSHKVQLQINGEKFEELDFKLL